MNLDPYTAGPLKEVVELVSILMRPPRSCHLLIKSPCLVETGRAQFFNSISILTSVRPKACPLSITLSIMEYRGSGSGSGRYSGSASSSEYEWGGRYDSSNASTNGRMSSSSHHSSSSSSSSHHNSSAAAGAHASEKAPKRSINELLRQALEDAATPGIGDEEPEVLPAPVVQSDPNKAATPQESPAEKAAREEFVRAQLAMQEEERRVAELNFDPNALLPCDKMEERAKYIPLRLTYEERKNLRLVNAAINVSDYTNTIDTANFKSKTKRQHTQLQYIVAFLTGLIAASDYAKGQSLLSDRNFTDYEEQLQTVLEIARRYKVTNPEKMRSEYGKLVYLMQDANSEEVKALLGVEINRPITTVYGLLEARGGLAILTDPAISTATAEILPDRNKSRHVIDLEIKRKEQAANKIVRTHTTPRLNEETIRSCLYSISDNNSFLNSNLKPIKDCIMLLKQYFAPSTVEAGYSLAIDAGTSGARLTHSHELQFNYVLQSLALWAAIVEDMFRLWYLSEQDLVSECQPYDLRQTGQGLQRVQPSPRVYKAMHEILARTKVTLGGWVGSSVIHLGDNNVPNDLVFIDKYTQVPRILGPLVKTLENLETAVADNDGLHRYIDAYGGIEKAKKDILHDFFTHAFDGSGGDNFFDAGSCIDGRLTSAWNWCSQLSSKPYYPLFKLTGFLSFDGQFDN
jgi:hypothetical protein